MNGVLGTTMTNESYIHEGVKSTLNSRDAWFNSVQNILSSCLFFAPTDLNMQK
jgi:hypothetical protein